MKINKILIIICLFTLFMKTLHSADDQAILKVNIQRAFQFEQQGNAVEAERIYKQLLKNFPHNSQVISRLVNLYLRNNKLNSLELLLENEKDFFTQNNYEIIKIELLIKKNKIDQAKDMVDDLLNKTSLNSSIVRKIAKLYQNYSLYDDAILLYQRARKKSQNPSMFAFELANIYQLQGKSHEALNEYLEILNERTYKEVLYRLSKLELSYEEIIQMLQSHQETNNTIELQELIGEFYILSKQYQQAFDIYKNLGENAIYKLAQLTEKMELYDLSIKCLKEIRESTQDEQDIIFLENKLGELYYLLNDNKKAKKHYQNVLQIYQNTTATLPSEQIYIAYKNLAFIELFDNQDPKRSQEYLEKALTFATSSEDKAELSILLSQCLLQQENYVRSEKILQDILNNKVYKEEILTKAQMHLIETFILKGDFSMADSLSKVYFTHQYESIYINDIASMYRTINNELNLQMANDSLQAIALSFLRNKYFNRNEQLEISFWNIQEAVQDTLVRSYLTLNIADYYYDQGEYPRAFDLFNSLLESDEHPYREYTYLMAATSLDQLGLNAQAQAYYTDYLMEFPQGSFAPEIRLRLKKHDF